MNKKQIVQRSELIVSRKKNHSRIEPQQLRKTVNIIEFSEIFVLKYILDVLGRLLFTNTKKTIQP